MTKKKKGGDEEEQKPKRAPVARRSKHATLKNAKRRQARHEYQAKKKDVRLVKRCEALEALLDAKGVDRPHYPDRPDKSIGARYRRLWRTARRHGLVGTPIKKKARAEKPAAKKWPSPDEVSQGPETTE